jgi:PAS domain S-box-containing protein
MATRRILIVEDEAILALGLQTRLELLGYEVVGVAENAPQAVELAMSERPELILMDIRLRGAEDGIQAATRIREQCRVPVIFLSAFSDEETLRRARLTEPFGYLIKPCQDRELHATIEMALHKHASETRLRESEQRFAATLSSIGDGIIAVDRQGYITLLNGIAEELTGWKKEYAIGKPIGEVFRIIGSRTREAIPCPVMESLRTGQPVTIPDDTILIRKDGREIPVDDTASPISIEETSDVIGAVIAFRDVTDRRQAEQQLRHAQKLESLGVLAGGIAHDFNNLLTPILGYAAMVKEIFPAESPAALMVEQIERSARQAADLTHQMLAYAGKSQVIFEPILLTQLVQEMASLMSIGLSKKASLVLQLADPLPTIQGDRSQMRQVIMNLLTNASESLGDQSGTITLRTYLRDFPTEELMSLEPPRYLPSGSYVVLEVRDTGCGMSPEVIQRIFDPFFTTKFTGRGLGLSAVQGIVRSHRGTMNIESQLGKGSTFRVFLPASFKACATEVSTVTPSAKAIRGRILVIDDEPAIRLFMERALKSAGFEVMTAADGLSGVEMFLENRDRIDLVVMDMLMPKLDGFEAATRVREAAPTTKILLMTGYSEDEVNEQFAQLPLNGILNKPFTPMKLIELARKCLG